MKRALPILVATLGLSATARADLVGVSPGGTKALARGGAALARPSDPMLLLHNPAALTALRRPQLLVNVALPIGDTCFDPEGYYGWGVYDPGVSEFGDSGDVATDSDGNAQPGQYATTRLPKVCNSAPPLPVPQIAYAAPLGSRAAYAFGFVGPDTIVNQQWGGKDGTIERGGVTLPSPARYQLVTQKLVAAFAPTAALAYQVLPRLSVGANFQWGMFGIETTAMQSRGAGTSPHNDQLVKLRTFDFFVPSAALAVHAIPFDALDVGLVFQYRGDVNGSTTAEYTTNVFHQNSPSGSIPYENDPLTLAELSTPLPWTLSGGARYAWRLAPRDLEAPARDGDPLSSELWDIEVDASYVFSRRASRTTARVEDTCATNSAGDRVPDPDRPGNSLGCQNLEFRRDGLDPLYVDVPAANLDEVVVDRHLKNQTVIRVGGGYNPLPGRLGLHTGAFYETRGVEPAFTNIDVMPFARVGVGGGAVLRLGNWDLMAAYGHVFSETLRIKAPAHQSRTLADGDPRSGFDKTVRQPCRADDVGCAPPEPLEDPSAKGPSDGTAAHQQSSFVEDTTRQARVVNAGTYTASFDVVSVGVGYRFE